MKKSGKHKVKGKIKMIRIIQFVNFGLIIYKTQKMKKNNLTHLNNLENKLYRPY